MKNITLVRLKEIKENWNDSTPFYNATKETYDDLLEIVEELIAVREESPFIENQRLCLGYNETDSCCDGDLVATPHETYCPSYKLDKEEFRSYLYVGE